MLFLNEDRELDSLRQKRLLQLKRSILRNKNVKTEEQKTKEKIPENFLKTVFVGRAQELWSTAERQYPQATKKLEKILGDLLKTGKLKGPLTGEQIFSLFRRIGLPVRLKTKIRILESGELKTIADKLKEK